MIRFAILLLAAYALTPAKKAEVVNLQQLQALYQNKTDDTLYVVNFWATWCKPCVAEMPYFIEADKKFKDQKIKVLFVSLNSANEAAKVSSFIAGKGIEEDVYLLNAGNPNVWIDKIDSTWGGSIPATMMYKNGKKVYFAEREFEQAALESIIKFKLSKP